MLFELKYEKWREMTNEGQFMVRVGLRESITGDH